MFYFIFIFHGKNFNIFWVTLIFRIALSFSQILQCFESVL